MRKRYLVPALTAALIIASPGIETGVKNTYDAIFSQKGGIEQVVQAPKSNLEGMVGGVALAQGTSPERVDYVTLAQKVVDLYEKEIRPKNTHKNADFIYDKLSEPLESLLGADLKSLPNEIKIALGDAFNKYGVILNDVRKDFDRAAISFKKAVELNPRDYHSLVDLAVLYFLHKDDVKTAKLYIDEAYRMNPKDIGIKSWYKKISAEIL